MARQRSALGGRWQRRRGDAWASAILALAFGAGPPGGAAAERAEGSDELRGSHCVEGPGARLVLHELGVAVYNTLGAEHSMRLGLCAPLSTRPGAIFELTNVEVGLVSYLSPAYSQLGGYAQLTPLSVLQLRAEVSWLGYWPFFGWAGYRGLPGYEADSRPTGQPGVASGWNVNLVVVLRARVPVGPFALVVFDMLNMELWALGEAPYYVNARRDLVLHRTDWVAANEAIVALEVRVSAGLDLRLGAYDGLRHGLGSGVTINHAGLIVMPVLHRAGRSARDLTPFLRVGVYTHHPVLRGGVTLMAGVMVSYSLAPL